MYNQIRIYPYKIGGNGASLLSEALRERGYHTWKVFPSGRYIPRKRHLMINWGFSTLPNWTPVSPFLNTPEAVRGASNKLIAFRMMQEGGISIPEFTSDYGEAVKWFHEDILIIGRKVLNGHSGHGIEMYRRGGPEIGFVGDAPLYVKYIKKADEYRVHVFNGRVIDIQQKKKRREVANEEVDYQIRSHSNGWVFCREDVQAPDSVLRESINAVNVLNLDFGAVDVIWNNKQERAYVLEVNTAPGLEGETVNKYVDSIIGVFNQNGN